MGVQRDARPLGGDAVRGEHVVDDLVERHLVEGGLDGARVDLRHLEQVVDHLGQPDRLLLDVLGVAADLVVGDHAVADRLGDRADARPAVCAGRG